MPRTPSSKRKQSRLPGIKRPQSGYTIFCNRNWEQVKQQVEKSDYDRQKNKQQCVIMKQLSTMWNGMKDKDKKPFERQARKDSLRYQKQKGEYLRTQPPRKPRNNPYIYFFKDVQLQIRQKNPDLKQSQIAQEVAKMWGGVRNDPTEMQKYHQLYEKDMQLYQTRMAQHLG
jgi:hypothetical protein